MLDGECGDCGVVEGQLHKHGCDMERCAYCNGQLISCACAYKMLGYNYDFNAPYSGLPPKIYHDGLSEKEYTKWLAMVDAYGRIPHIIMPNMCGRCGKLWPEMFRVPDEEWRFYLGIDESLMLCHDCYDRIKQLIDARSGLKKYPPRVTEVIAKRNREHAKMMHWIRSRAGKDT